VRRRRLFSLIVVITLASAVAGRGTGGATDSHEEHKANAAPGPRAPAVGAIRANSGDGLSYVWVPSGTFTMGCSVGDSECFDDEKPAHQVTISKGFWIGQTLVTQKAYKRVTGLDPSYFRGKNCRLRWLVGAMLKIIAEYWECGCRRKRNGNTRRGPEARRRATVSWMRSRGTRARAGHDQWMALRYTKPMRGIMKRS
jgi:formylglycine-generating enzyme required for sulfatase activity